VETRIFYGIIVLFFISTATAFAQQELSVQTDDSHYDEGDVIVISGNVGIVIGETPVIIQIINEGAYAHFAQITVAQDGSFTDTAFAEGKFWKNAGKYIVKASYQDQTVEIEITFSPKTEIQENKDTFKNIVAGDYGTIDIDYTITGGTIKNMIIDSDNFAIVVQIESPDEGTITLDLPREFIGAEKQDGKDDTFIILIDGIEVPYQESLVHPDSRVITINFEEGDSDIEIIGTYVVPEFGTIVMMILIVGIMTVILASRNKFQIKI
jgi:predicted secreted protein with PEFG-CTERM motif